MYENITPETIKESILSNITTVDTREGSFVSDMVAPTAQEIWSTYQEFNTMLQTMFIDTNSGDYIDKRCAEYGIMRKAGSKATGQVTFTGASATTIPSGTIIQTLSGLQFITTADCTISSTTITVNIEAIEAGYAYNVLTDSIVQMVVNIVGVTSLTNASATTGGVDIESDADLVTRFYNALQNPSTSGNANDYVKWALEVTGVGGAKVFPLWNGNGTVKVVCIDSNKNPLSSGLITTVTNYIASVRPIGATVTVISATALNINVTATMTLASYANLTTVTNAFKTALDTYLKSLAFNSYTVFYNKIGSMLSDIDGVVDYTNLKVNNGTANITVGAEQVAVMNTVTLS